MNIGASDDNPATWYVAASYRFNKYFETGAYYTQYSAITASAAPWFDPANHLTAIKTMRP